ncbi:MAG: methyltransferase domain-containing protein [Bacteroidota bacterium]|jgi:2-polyprenyl-3-methyl-5-hydroxy-6-metoxy-1,4-benzoquinol methylase|nr:methyltransferase domain-containing protein [Bacteroidota bacterium]
MFENRSVETEIMDDLEGGGTDMDQALRELEIINMLLGGNHISINGLEILLKEYRNKGNSIRIADLGCGGGDILKLMAEWGRKKKLKLDLTGIDANPNIIKYAKNNSGNYPEINYQMVNIFSDDFRKQKFDIVHCCLFTHHFSDSELINLFSHLKTQANIGIIVNDLHRHWLAYYSIKIITRLASKSDMVKNDGPISVLRAFKKEEVKKILLNSGINDYLLKWKWAFRWQLIVRFQEKANSLKQKERLN